MKKIQAEQEQKVPFDLEEALDRVASAIEPFPKAAFFQLASEGFDSVFEQLVACIISIRTLDEVTVVVARRLFGKAKTPAAIATLGIKEIDTLIQPSTFHEAKARQLFDIAIRARDEYAGRLPGDREILLSFQGVGPKCANLALGIACGVPSISVDIHVHRIVNRWGIVSTKQPEKTLEALETIIPTSKWIVLNSLLVPFGKHVCLGRSPKCSTCPILKMCRQVGVTSHR